MTANRKTNYTALAIIGLFAMVAVLAGCGNMRTAGPGEPYFFAPADKTHAAISVEHGCPMGTLWVGTKRRVAGVPDPECR